MDCLVHRFRRGSRDNGRLSVRLRRRSLCWLAGEGRRKRKARAARAAVFRALLRVVTERRVILPLENLCSEIATVVVRDGNDGSTLCRGPTRVGGSADNDLHIIPLLGRPLPDPFATGVELNQRDAGLLCEQSSTRLVDFRRGCDERGFAGWNARERAVNLWRGHVLPGRMPVEEGVDRIKRSRDTDEEQQRGAQECKVIRRVPVERPDS